MISHSPWLPWTAQHNNTWSFLNCIAQGSQGKSNILAIDGSFTKKMAKGSCTLMVILENVVTTEVVLHLSWLPQATQWNEKWSSLNCISQGSQGKSSIVPMEGKKHCQCKWHFIEHLVQFCWKNSFDSDIIILVLAALDSTTQQYMILFDSHYAWWPRQELQCRYWRQFYTKRSLPVSMTMLWALRFDYFEKIA